MKTDLNIINEPEKILNLLNLVAKTKSYVYLRHGLMEYNGTIEEIIFDQFVFSTDYKLSINKNVVISFNYRDNFYYFNTDVIEVNKRNLILKVPKEIFIHFKRQSKRYKIQSLNITCNLKLISSVAHNKTLLHHMKYSAINFDDIYQEIENERPDLQKIIQLINRNKKNLFDELRIIAPIEKLNDKIIINFIKAYKKIFFINGTTQERSYFENPDPNLMLTYKDYFDLLEKSNKSDADIQKNLKILMEQYNKSQIFSALYIPIMIMEKIVGVLCVLNFMKHARLFNPHLVQYFIHLATLISEAIVKNKLNSIDDHTLNIKVTDMSLSGIGIEFSDPILLNYFIINSKLDVTLNLSTGKKVQFVGIVKNIVKSIVRYKIGIEIQEILPGNRTRIINFINKAFLGNFEAIK